ncbi:hypothetical protein FEM48_Zijuj09G0154200 [Ziziphus jujuba var. spinosa]|nr:hypothetical protein FEM48_Zijuj09G0154200 [Ziziphus jujuba var. spinosa]
MLRNMLKDKVNNSAEQKSGGDLVDQMIRDMDKEKYLSEELVVQMLYSALFATFESVSAVIALAFQLLSDHPSVLQELTAEQDAVFRRKKDPNSPLTWDDYKSMTFTLQVINETLRLGNVAPGLLRKVLKDIEVKGKGFTIPAGWTIMVVTSALQMNPDTYKNPLEFNPWRWKEMDSDVISKNFSPFGGGTRQCAGAEFSRAFMCIFFHVLLTKYRWTKIKGATISRNPILGFGKGIHIRFAQQYVN